MRKIVTIVSSLCVIVVAQDQRTPKESEEHLFARTKYTTASEKADKIKEDLASSYTVLKGLVDSCPMPKKPIKEANEEEQQQWTVWAACYKNVMPKVKALTESRAIREDEYKKLSETILPVLKVRLDQVDECLRLYTKTIDEKASDLTIRETKLVSGCTAANLYPPEK